jgi:hypothetical protein
MCYLLESLQSKGWNVLTTLDISWKEKDKSIFILEKYDLTQKNTDLREICAKNVDATDSNYRAFHGFCQAKFAYGGSIVGTCKFTLPPQLPLKKC